jgi:hypothetical protein
MRPELCAEIKSLVVFLGIKKGAADLTRLRQWRRLS